RDPVMQRLRDIFRQEHGVQCGYCTSGMLITSLDIVTRLASADEQRIRTELAGNLCRCTGYVGIVNAVQRVMREMPAEARLRAPERMTVPVHDAKPFRTFDPMDEDSHLSLPATVPATQATSGRGWLRLTDHFVVAAPRSKVWEFFSDFPRVARCMPGAELKSNDGSNLAGNLRVAFGPIKATFSGLASVESNVADFSGRVRGGGNDPKGGSRARGQVTYRLIEEHASSTRVELTLEFQLQGPLAQFGRTGLVKDFAGRLIAQFARNLLADLEGAPVRGNGGTAAISAG